jgi:hypothetical protein
MRLKYDTFQIGERHFTVYEVPEGFVVEVKRGKGKPFLLDRVWETRQQAAQGLLEHLENPLKYRPSGATSPRNAPRADEPEWLRPRLKTA